MGVDTCEHGILKMNEPGLMLIVTIDPRSKGMKRSTSWSQDTEVILISLQGSLTFSEN